MTRTNGIDVSRWQGTIDWMELKKSTDLSFAIIRVGAGNKKDSMFKTNITQALAQKIPCGVYLYSHATTKEQAVKEAEFVIKAVKQYTIQYPIYYDIEDDRQLKLTTPQRTQLCKAFCDKILEANYIPGIYANSNWFNTKLDLSQLKKYEKWVAHWGTTEPDYDGAYGMWQYSSTGKVKGIDTAVDLNYCYIDYTKYSQNFKIGQKIILENTPVYTSSVKKTPSSYMNGTYYIYDGILLNNRFRITNLKKNVNATPISSKVTGYVKLDDILDKE